MRVSTDRCELEVRVWGEGEPILTIHGGFCGEWFHPLLHQPVLDEYKRIAYWRHGYRYSSHPEAPPYPVENVAEDAFAVLKRTGGDSGHVVGHSLGGLYALQLALSHPDAVRTLILIEPTVLTPEFGEWMAGVQEQLQAEAAPVDASAGTHVLLTSIHGDGTYRNLLDSALPEDWFEQAVADEEAGQTVEVPALQEWRFGPDEAKRIQCPVLLIRGGRSIPVFEQMVGYLKEWIPHAQEHIVPGAGHSELLAHPAETAEALANFLSSQRSHESMAVTE